MNQPANHTSRDEDQIHILDYLIILAKHSRMIILVSLGAAVLTYIFLFCCHNTYKATARLLPPQQNMTLSAQLLDSLGGSVSPGGGADGLAGGMGGMAANLLGLKSPREMYVAMMTSETVVDPIIARFNLKKLYKTKTLEDTRKALSKRCNISAGKRDGIIVIEVTSTAPQLAANLANAFIEELDRLLQELAVQEAKGRAVFLEKERLQASQNLAKAEEALRLFSEKNSVLQIDTQTRGAIEYIARLRAEIDAKEVNVQVLRQQATPVNYDVVRMETEIKGLKEKLHNAESQLESCVSDVCMPTSKAPGLGLEYLRLFREAKFQEGLYKLYTRLVEVARLDMVRDVAVVQVLAPAKPPEKRSNRRLIPASLVGGGAFILMVFLSFFREFLDKLKTSQDESQRLATLALYWQPYQDSLTRLMNWLRFKGRY